MENKQIQEIAKDLKECLPSSWYYLKSVDSDTYCVAKHFLNEGYRKIEKDDIVLSKLEHQKYLAYKIIEPQIKGCLDRERELEKTVEGLRANLKRNDEHLHIRIKEQTRKETAKYLIDEFATMLVALKVGKVFNKKLENPISQGAYLFMLENLKRLAQEFSVEIGENK